MSRIYDTLLHLIRSSVAPYFCLHCRSYLSTHEPLCSSCLSLIEPTLSTTLTVSHAYKIQVHSISAYEDPLKTLILAKNKSDYEASVHLGTLLWRSTPLPSMAIDYLIPVPLHWRKQAQRGYNQAYVMAKRVALLNGITLLDCVKRVRYTAQQSRYSFVERHANVRNAFNLAVQADAITGKNIVLIDDMMTSGATILELARVLSEKKPRKITAVVACGAFEG